MTYFLLGNFQAGPDPPVKMLWIRNPGTNVKMFRRAAEARMCEKGHRGIFSFKCHMCEYKTNKKNHLDRHIESHLKVS